MKNLLSGAHRTRTSVIAAGFCFLAAMGVQAQDRDVRGERLVLDDGAGDGGLNTLIIRVPAGGLSSSRTLTFPDADGDVITSSPGGLTANQILFGDATGMAAQSANLVWNNGTSTLNIGPGNFSVDGSTGNVTAGGSLTLGDDLFPTRGRVLLHDNLDLNGFQGTIQTASVLTGNRTYTLPDASGTLALTSDLATNTDATLTGDGSIGTPFGIDLTNANSWTGAQTFSSVDVNGGAIDGTAIGAASPSTGTFTTITGGSTLTLGDDLFPTRGRVILHDNLDLNGFQGTIQTASVLTGNRTYSLPDASGTLALTSDLATNTDATLTGDGSIGTPFGIDLTNANSWTGAQTFSSVDVNGGAIDGTAIGAASPSTGTFTTITGGSTLTLGDDLFPTRGRVILHDNLDLNGFQGTIQTASVLTGNRTYTLPDANGTLALTSDIAVTTNSTLLGDGTGGDPLRINLSNTNTWTGTQTFGQVAVLSIATFDADVTLGDSPTDALTANGTFAGATPLSFEGATSDVNETTFAITDPTADRTITFPDASGTVAFLSDVSVTTNSTLLGDGTGGDPLRINLSNTNTWTGTQTFGQVAVLSIATFDADVTLGDSPTDALTANGTFAGATPLSFEGATSDVNETTFAITDPTADRTITFPDASGTVAFLSDVSVTTNSTLLGDGTGGDPLRINLSNTNTWTGTQTFGQVAVLSIATFDADVTLGDSPTDALTANGTFAGATPLSFEGATSDVNETTFAITDPTADRTITFPDASGTVAFLSDVSVTTNSTLLGDGTGGDPLRINLSNANSWTGAQTFSSVDINGGTIDGTAIGAAVPSSASVTTFIASGAADLQGAVAIQGTVTNPGGVLTLDDDVSVTGALTLGDGNDNVSINVGTDDLNLIGIDAGAATDEFLTINTGTNAIGRRAGTAVADQGVSYDAANGEFVLGAATTGTNPITTGRFVTVNNQLTVDGSGIADFQTPTLRLGETGTTALSIGNTATDHTIAGNNVTGTFGGTVGLTSSSDISLNHSLTGGGVTTLGTVAVSSSGSSINAAYTTGGITDLSEILLDATSISAVSYTDDGLGNLTNYFELTADHSAQSLSVTILDDVNTPGNLIQVTGDNPSNTFTVTTTDQVGSASLSLVGANGSEAVALSAGTGALTVEPTQTSVTGDLTVAGSTTITNAGGVGLEVTSGGVLLSYGSGAPATIPDDVAVFDVDDATGASAPTVALPAGGANGQILYVYVSDPDGATVGGVAQATGDRLTYIYASGAWQLFHLN